MTDSNVAALPIEAKPLVWRDHGVEPRDISLAVQKEANKIAADGDKDGSLLHVLAHSLHWRDGPNAGKRVFRTLAQIREEVTYREYFKVMSLAVACVKHNNPDVSDIPPELQREIDDKATEGNGGPK